MLFIREHPVPRNYVVLLAFVILIGLTASLFIHYEGPDHRLPFSRKPNKRPSSNHYSSSQNPGLAPKDFENWVHGEFIPSEETRNRFLTNEVWRSSDTFVKDYYMDDSNSRPSVPPLNRHSTKGEYLQQTLIADYAQGADDIFLMIKTGSNILWDSLPVHFFTTLTRVPNFALYADSAGSMAGHEVIDILRNMTDSAKSTEDLSMYRALKNLHAIHSSYDAEEIKFTQGWDLDKFKNLPMLYHAWKSSPESKWFMFIDADTYVMFDTLLEVLKKKDYREPLYYGSIAALGNKPFCHGGSGVILSQEAMRRAFDIENVEAYLTYYERETFRYCCGDFMVALYLDEVADIGVTNSNGIIQGNQIWDLGVKEDLWCSPIATFHHVHSNDIEVLWEYERMRGPHKRNIRYVDIYRDFMLPYLVDEKVQWDNNAQSEEFDPEKYGGKVFKLNDPSSLKPHESMHNCKEACLKTANCLSWRYIPEKNYCGLGKDIRLGRPLVENTKQKRPASCTSGWMIDRIRDLRRQQKCDILFDDPDADGLDDGSSNDRKEGWFYRVSQVQNEIKAEKHVVMKKPPKVENNEKKEKVSTV